MKKGCNEEGNPFYAHPFCLRVFSVIGFAVG